MAPAKKEGDVVEEGVNDEVKPVDVAAAVRAAEPGYPEKGTFPKIDDPELVKHFYSVLHVYGQSLSSGNPLAIEWLAEELKLGLDPEKDAKKAEAAAKAAREAAEQ